MHATDSSAVRARRSLHWVDVFASRRYGGNPLAVVTHAEGLPAVTMQAIAAEFDLSETTFVHGHPDADGAWPTRMFTPAREIAFAGHPILGTAWVVAHHLARADAGCVDLALGLGRVRVERERDGAGIETWWFRAPPIAAGAIVPADAVAAALGLERSAIDDGSPCQSFSAGSTSAIIAPLTSLASLRRCRLDAARFAPLAAAGHAPLVYAFCRETRSPANQLSARFFFEANGVREDPATGNGAAFLAEYLLTYRSLGPGPHDLRIEQGHEIARPSLVRLRASSDADRRDVRVGGGVFPVADGELLE